MRIFRRVSLLAFLTAIGMQIAWGQPNSTAKVVNSAPRDSVVSFVKLPGAILRDAPSGSARKLAAIPQYGKIMILGKPIKNYSHIVYQGQSGYILSNYIDLPKETEGRSQLNQGTAKGTFWSLDQNSPSHTETARTYHSGSRGGCFYINSSGSKKYVHEDFCK